MIHNPFVGGSGSVELEWHELMTVSTYAPPTVTLVQGIIPIDPHNMPRYVIVQADMIATGGEVSRVPIAIIYNGGTFNAEIPSQDTQLSFISSVGTGTYIETNVTVTSDSITIEVANSFQWKYAFIY